MNSSPTTHIPVLAKTLAEQINIPRDATMVDATVGQGGHSFLFGDFLGPQGVLVGLDVDKKSLSEAKSKLEPLTCKVILLHSNFSKITELLQQRRIRDRGKAGASPYRVIFCSGRQSG